MSRPSDSPINPGRAATPDDRLDFIDSLRGWAALYVLSYHLVAIPDPDLPVPASIAQFVSAGGMGVTLFFVLSAFTLCLSSSRRSADGESVAQFYIRRVFRIVPLFLLWFLISLVRDFVWYGVVRTPREVMLNLSFLFSLVPGQHEGFVWAGWTLSVEMLFYLVFPFLFRVVRSLWKALSFFAAAAILSIAWNHIGANFDRSPAEDSTFVEMHLLNVLPSFAFGICCFHLSRLVRNLGRPVLLGTVLFVACAALFAVTLGILPPGPLQAHYWQSITFGTLLLSLVCFPFAPIVNAFSRYLGKLSYSVYLNHPTIVAALSPIYVWIYALPLPVWVKFGGAFLLTLGVVLGSALFTYRFIEEPGIRLGSSLARSLKTRQVRNPGFTTSLLRSGMLPAGGAACLVASAIIWFTNPPGPAESRGRPKSVKTLLTQNYPGAKDPSKPGDTIGRLDLILVGERRFDAPEGEEITAQRGETIHISGWIFRPGSQARRSRLIVRLKSEQNGAKWYVAAHRAERHDVAEALNLPAADHSGLFSIFDLPSAIGPGRYQIRVIEEDDTSSGFIEARTRLTIVDGA